MTESSRASEAKSVGAPGFASHSPETLLNVEALEQISPCIAKLQEACHRAGRKYSKLANDCKVLHGHIDDLVKSPPVRASAPEDEYPPDDVPRPTDPQQEAPSSAEDGPAPHKEPSEEPAEPGPPLTAGGTAASAEDPAPAAADGEMRVGQEPAADEQPPADFGEAAEEANGEDCALGAQSCEAAAESTDSHANQEPAEVEAGPGSDGVVGENTDGNAEEEERADAPPRSLEKAGHDEAESDGAVPATDHSGNEPDGADPTRDHEGNGLGAPAAEAKLGEEPGDDVPPAAAEAGGQDAAPPPSESVSSPVSEAEEGDDKESYVKVERNVPDIEALKSKHSTSAEVDPNAIVALEVLRVLKRCIGTRRPSIVEIALECLHRMVIYKLVCGQCSSVSGKHEEGVEHTDSEEDTSPPSLLVELYCKCEDIQDDSVELGVMRGLLTCVSSLTLTVHSQALLLVVRCCYNIYLTSRSEVNQATAKASLTQMVNIVFQRMEANSVVVPMQPIMVSDILGLGPSMSSDTASVASVVQTFLNRVVDDFTAPPNPDALREGLDAAFASDRGGMDGDEMADNQDGGSSQGQASPHPPAPPATPEQQPRNPSDTHWRTPQEGASASKFTSSMSVGSANREQSHCSLAAKALQQSGPSSAVLLRDAFLVFRSLCKLSSKTSDSSPGMDAMAIRGKLLSLELIKILLENSGPVFARSERFISAVKQHLCLSLLKNSASPVPQAQRLSCSILLTLVRKFRQTLKAEVNEFFPMILLKALEPVGGTMATVNTSPSANIPFSPAHVTVILRCLKEQCSDGQLLVDLFVNYDCDLEGSNIFERMVIGLVRIAQGHGTLPDTASKQVQEQEAQHQLMSTECLVAILKSLVAWYLNGTAQAQEDGEQAEAVDAAEQSQGKKAKDRSVGNLSSASDAETDAGDKATREWEMVESRKAYKMGFQEGIALFNKKPQDGIRFMQEQGMLGKEPHEIAAFLGKTSGLNRTKIGEYLGEREDTALKVMHAYIDAMDFTDMDIDEAIRKFLADFRLPGEAQKIDRLMEKFAERYFMDNPSSLFKSADVAYVLAFSVIMLNTDAHNPMVKVKMTKEGFISNNRGINDGHDLPQEYLSDLYDRIVSNEIKMKDMELLEGRQAAPKEAPSAAKGWVDTIMGLIGRRNADLNEPSDDALHRTLDYLKEKAKGATFFTATDGETVRPMVEVAWAPMLGAFSVLYEDSMSPELCQACLEGFYYAVTLTSTLGMTMLRDTYVTSLSRFTSLHNPGNMTLKSAEALRTLIAAAERNSNNFQGAWPEVLRCVSRFDLLMQQHSGAPADSVLFAQNTAEPEKPEKQKRKFFRRSRHSRINDAGPMSDIDSTMREEREVITMAGETAAVGLQDVGTPRKPVHRPLAVGELMPAPPPGVLNAIDTEDLNRLFVCSDRLNSTAIVEFVTALCSVSLEELANTSHPRVYGLTKIVEIAHFNMTRIRLVWNRIWAVLSDYFITVGCHQNLSVAIFAVDSLRQLAMKFLERDELANYTFQNDFLRPFVVVMRQSSSLEIRELIIRCVSQMVLARVANVKSGWKSMFMVFTTAAQDEAQQIVRLSFETIEKIVREHFEHITETEVATFTDCVNCLIAFTNNSHSLDVALNAIAFLRFCAMKLADGTIGSVDELPEEALKEGEHHIGKASGIRCIDGRVSDGSDGRGDEAALARAEADTDGNILIVRGASGRLHFTDKDEHMYFWFPLLAGLSELTFDPRPDIRYSALEVLFDILRYHGKCFSASFWARVFDSVIFPIFDHVRAEVTDTTTFSDDRRRADEDKWLYETCTKCLQHLIDLFCHFFSVAQVMLPRLLELLKGFIRRSHQSLAAVGVAALVRLISEAGPIMSDAHWLQTMQAVRSSAVDTMPQVADLVWVSHASSGDGDGSAEIEAIGDAFLLRDWSLSEGVGSRRLSEMHCRAAVQLLLVQAAGEVYARHCRCLPSAAVVVILDVLRGISSHARAVDADLELRRALANKQAADGVAEHRCLPDPPLMKLESEASHSYLSVLLHISMAPGASEAKSAACIEERLVELCVANLQRYEEVGPFSDPGNAAALEDALAPSNISMTTSTAEHSVRAPLVVATLRALSSLGDEEFRRHLHEFFPLLTRLISCQHAPVEVQRALSTLFQKRIGPLLQ